MASCRQRFVRRARSLGAVFLLGFVQQISFNRLNADERRIDSRDAAQDPLVRHVIFIDPKPGQAGVSVQDRYAVVVRLLADEL